MELTPIQHPVSQRRFAFARDETWKELSATTREKIILLLKEMLCTAISHEKQTEESNHERQDSI